VWAQPLEILYALAECKLLNPASYVVKAIANLHRKKLVLPVCGVQFIFATSFSKEPWER
jgi:hypothetical protein